MQPQDQIVSIFCSVSVTRTESRCQHCRELGIGEIVFAVLAEPAEGLGYVTLAEDDIEALAAVTEGTHILVRS